MHETVERIADALAARDRVSIDRSGFARASVLVPVLSRPGGPRVLFTQRTETVRDHPGQISFPGGRLEPGEGARSAALREASEEVGLAPAAVEVVGLLDDQLSVSRFIVTPVVGIVGVPPATFVAEKGEVVESFEVALERLRDRRFYREERWGATRIPAGWSDDEIVKLRSELLEWDPVTQTYPVSFFDGGGGRVIWGLTARILKQLLDVAFGFSAAP